MKTFKGLNFGMSVVNAGQRAVSEEPELVATSTSGGFRISSSVSRAMGIGSGDYIMFIKNVDEEITRVCDEKGVTPDSPFIQREYFGQIASTAVAHA